MNNMHHISRHVAVFINCTLLLWLGVPAAAQEIPLEEQRTRVLMKDRTPIRHMEITVKGKKRRLPVFDSFKSGRLTILQAGAEPGFKEQKPGRFDSFDLLSTKTLEGSGSTFINRDYLSQE